MAHLLGDASTSESCTPVCWGFSSPDEREDPQKISVDISARNCLASRAKLQRSDVQDTPDLRHNIPINWDLNVASNQVSIMPRNASLSDTQQQMLYFSQSLATKRSTLSLHSAQGCPSHPKHLTTELRNDARERRNDAKNLRNDARLGVDSLQTPRRNFLWVIFIIENEGEFEEALCKTESTLY